MTSDDTEHCQRRNCRRATDLRHYVVTRGGASVRLLLCPTHAAPLEALFESEARTRQKRAPDVVMTPRQGTQRLRKGWVDRQKNDRQEDR